MTITERERETDMNKTVRQWAVALGLCACMAAAQAQRTPVPVMNFEGIPVTLSTDKPLSPEQVRRAFISAGAVSGWAVEPKGDGQLEAVYRKGDKHTVVVALQYTATTYSLRYVSSINMKYADRIDSRYERPGAITSPAETAAQAQDKLFAGRPEGPYERPAAKAVIHPFYEAWVHALLDATRLQLKAEATK